MLVHTHVVVVVIAKVTNTHTRTHAHKHTHNTYTSLVETRTNDNGSSLSHNTHRLTSVLVGLVGASLGDSSFSISTVQGHDWKRHNGHGVGCPLDKTRAIPNPERVGGVLPPVLPGSPTDGANCPVGVLIRAKTDRCPCPPPPLPKKKVVVDRRTTKRPTPGSKSRNPSSPTPGVENEHSEPTI